MGSRSEVKGEKSGAAILLEQARRKVDVFHTPMQEPFVRIKGAQRKHGTYPVRSTEFETWLRLLAGKSSGEPPDAEMLNKVISQLAAEARHNGPEREVHTRVASLGGEIYIDLGQPNNDAVHITADRWSIVTNPPVNFRRSNNTGPLARPKRKCNLKLLRPFVNVSSEEDWVLFVAATLGALSGRGPFAHLVIFGEQGSAKSTLAEVYKSLVDPVRRALTLSPPKSERDLAISAQDNYVLAYDNISSLPSWLSDCFCRLSTGGGFATRELYTNSGVVIFDAQRSVCLNGISEFAERGDLLDRSIVFQLPPIPEDQRKKQKDFWDEFRAVWPHVFGGLLDALSMGLKNQHTVKLQTLPRMADFAEWVVACEPALPWPPGAFLAAYERNRGEAVQIGLEANVVAQAVIELMETRAECTETPSALLNRLRGLKGIGDGEKASGWPTDAKALSATLKRMSPLLRKVGIDVSKDRSSVRRSIVLKRINPAAMGGDAGVDDTAA